MWSGPSAHLALNLLFLGEHAHLVLPPLLLFMLLPALVLPFELCFPHFFLAVMSLQTRTFKTGPVIFPFKLNVPFYVSVSGGRTAHSLAL